MAAIPSYLVPASRRPSDDTSDTTVAFSTNELGAQSFFPSTLEVTPMPTVQFSHTRKLGGMAPQVSAKVRLNDEYYSVGAGMAKDVGPHEVKVATERLFQRDEHQDKGWLHEAGVAVQVMDNVRARVRATKRVTDSGDKDLWDVAMGARHSSLYGTVEPEVTFIKRRGQGSLPAKAGKALQLTFKTDPSLSSMRASLYAKHSYRAWEEERPFISNELGLSLPFASGAVTLAALQTNPEQKELLERSALASLSHLDSCIALKLHFHATL